MKAMEMLRAHIQTLLMERRENQVSLANWAGHEKSWINKILKGEREPQMKDLDKIAEFFGLAAYQLFQPGISRLTERRVQGERRTHKDRRVGTAHRAMVELRSAIHPSSQRAAEHAAASDDADPVSVLAKDFARRIVAYAASADARRQDSAARRPVAKLRPRPRANSGSHADRIKPK